MGRVIVGFDDASWEAKLAAVEAAERRCGERALQILDGTCDRRVATAGQHHYVELFGDVGALEKIASALALVAGPFYW